MSEDIKELVKRLRAEEWATVEREQTRNAAADALEAMAGEVERLTIERDAFEHSAKEEHRMVQQGYRRAEAAEAERDRLAGEVDTLQMKLAACGVGALANTERTVAQRITKESPHWSASLGDVYHIVDKEMEARAERDRLKAAITTHVAGCVACGGSGVVFLCPERDDTEEAAREDCEECVGLRKALGGDA